MISCVGTRDRRLVHVTGVVQGVGFRPFVHRLALSHGLDGWVRNQSGDVEISIDGPTDAIDAFLRDLEAHAPPLAHIDRVDVRPVAAAADAPGFHILDSTVATDRRQPVPPDVAVCEACLRELLDPRDRRYCYPFITCTDCGPRYTVIESLPYDRERTTMRRFTQCLACRLEYETPGNRRHHSETNSCPVCGPLLWTQLPGAPATVPTREEADSDRPIRLAASFVLGGAIVAIRGVGGFHLAVDATNETAVRRLRERKHRESKPLAIMVATVEQARTLAELAPEEPALLADRARPIVLLCRRTDVDAAPLADAVAQGLDRVGVMLAYTPLHYLLLHLVDRPLVMTSGNLAEEPIAARVDDALARLGTVADLFLLHDREIESPVDDSVVRVIDGRAAFIRRARGYAPLPIGFAVETPRPLLAVGGQMKSTFTLAAGNQAFVSPHLGDLDTLETLRHYRATLERYESLFRVRPEALARDMHPGYLSTRVADEMPSRVIAVQHHHAHIAAVLGEHRRRGPVIGVAFDGTGYGDDGTVWGAEFLLADEATYTRVGHLRVAPLPGGELAVRSPWRSALGYLSLEPALASAFVLATVAVGGRERAAAEAQLKGRINSPRASSMGRLFDAAAAVLGVAHFARFEGEAAMRLESLAGSRHEHPLSFPIVRDGGGLVELDPLPLLETLGLRRLAGVPLDVLAAGFHESVAAATAHAAAMLCADSGIGVVALGGGVFQNARLTATLRARLEDRGLTVLSPLHLPANDGGLSYGQAIVAAARLRRE